MNATKSKQNAPVNREHAKLLLNKRVKVKQTELSDSEIKVVGIPYRNGLYLDSKFITFSDLASFHTFELV